MSANTIQQVTGKSTVVVDLLSGGTETVSVLEVRFKDIMSLTEAMGDEYKLLSVYTGKPAEWADTITRYSAERIIEEGDRLNLPFLHRWLERQAKRTAPLQGLLASSLNASLQQTQSQTLLPRQVSDTTPSPR